MMVDDDILMVKGSLWVAAHADVGGDVNVLSSNVAR